MEEDCVREGLCGRRLCEGGLVWKKRCVEGCCEFQTRLTYANTIAKGQKNEGN